MQIGFKMALTLTLLGIVSVAPSFAQSNKPAQDVLPKAPASAQTEALKKQLSRVIVFRDPVTGEFRAADPGEQAALTAGGAAVARAAAPTTGRLPDGGLYLTIDPTKLQFMTVVKKADGAVKYRCGAAGHESGEKSQGGRDEK